MGIREQQLAYLKGLAEALTGNGLTAELAGTGAQPYLKVANADTPGLIKRVLCHQAGDGPWSFWWPPIGSVDDLELVLSRIAVVVGSVEAGE